MKLRNLRAVMVVAKSGSMSAAAQALNLSQPAITRIINLLEDEFATRLFRRTHAGTELTLEGALLVQAGTEAFRQLSEIEDRSPVRFDDVALCLASSFTRYVSDHELSALIGVSAAGSPRRAAEMTGITQTALKRSLAALAARLGRPLFEPHSPTRLNAWAEDAAMKARRALGELTVAEDFLRQSHASIRAPVRLRIGALPASRVHLVPEAARRFSMEQQASEISIVDAGYEALLSQLHGGEIDLLVGSIRPRNLPPWAIAEPLFKDHLVVVSHPRHPLQQLAKVDWWDLRSARWVLPSKATPIRMEFNRLVTLHGIPVPAQIVEVDSFIAARAFLLGGDWLGIFSASQIVHEERARLLSRLPMSKLGEHRQVGVVTRRDQRPFPSLARFLDHLRAVASEISLLWSDPKNANCEDGNQN